MFAIRSIKAKILGLVIGIGVVLSFLLAFVAPWKAADLANNIHEAEALPWWPMK